jgi:hypothetical protein
MIKTTFRDYIARRQQWPDSLTLLSILGIDLFEPTPDQIRRWVAINQDALYQAGHDRPPPRPIPHNG